MSDTLVSYHCKITNLNGVRCIILSVEDTVEMLEDVFKILLHVFKKRLDVLMQTPWRLGPNA